MYHLIAKQRMHIIFNGSEAEALTLHGKLPAWCRDMLQPALERALDSCAPVNTYWSMGRLDIDAGSIPLDRLEQDLPGLIEQALVQSLRRLTLGTSDSALPDALSEQKKPVGDGIQLSVLQRLISAWMHFLVTGTLPWNVKLPEGKTLEQLLLESWQQQPSGFEAQTLLPVLADVTARKRLVLQFSDAFLSLLLEHIAPAIKTEVTAILETLKTSELPTETVNAFAKELWQAAFEPWRSTQTETETVQQTWQKLSVKTVQWKQLGNILERHWPGATSVAPANKSPETPVIEQKPGKSADITMPDNRLPASAHSESEIPNIHPPHSLMRGQTMPLPDEREGIYIDNAGLVILHPFLPQFFSALTIAGNGLLVQSERALCLLHFLGTGQTVAPEYELVLPKILCNLALTTPVAADVELTRAEQEEAEALLAAVIRHWDVLRNTSIDSLRGTFLMRAGKIRLRDDGDWLLQVEKKSFDILLEQLPWGIGAVKLPWMEPILWVEWM